MENLTDAPLPVLRDRPSEAHKGDFGRVMIVGGSRGMSGAVAMAGIACLRSGAGLTTLAVPASVQAVVAGHCPAYTTHALVDDDRGHLHWANATDLEAIADQYDVWAVGPGLGSPETLESLVGRMHAAWLTPLVIDADGLNALADYEKHHDSVFGRPGGQRVLTPHPGEFARLVNDPSLAMLASGGDAERLEAATELARRDDTSQTVVLLKGHHTVITDGERYAVNATGNPGMATGGSGDVLTGVITALLAQELDAFDAARLGAHVHGLAGDLAASAVGQVSLMATDVLDHLPQAFQRLMARG